MQHVQAIPALQEPPRLHVAPAEGQCTRFEAAGRQFLGDQPCVRRCAEWQVRGLRGIGQFIGIGRRRRRGVRRGTSTGVPTSSSRSTNQRPGAGHVARRMRRTASPANAPPRTTEVASWGHVLSGPAHFPPRRLQPGLEGSPRPRWQHVGHLSSLVSAFAAASRVQVVIQPCISGRSGSRSKRSMSRQPRSSCP